MEYEIDALDNKAGWFSGAHDKVASEFQKVSKKRVADGWTLHSYNHVDAGKYILTTIVWQRG